VVNQGPVHRCGTGIPENQSRNCDYGKRGGPIKPARSVHQNLDFIVRRVWQWHRCDIKECGEPRVARKWMSIPLVATVHIAAEKALDFI
jgi:hypothetical protein